MPFLLLLVFRGIHPLELSHFLFIALNASRRELDHPEEKVDVVYVALSEGFDGHVLEEVGHPYDSDELVPHHGPIAIIHVLWEKVTYNNLFFVQIVLIIFKFLATFGSIVFVLYFVFIITAYKIL